jgi:uncharacterized protein YndB with AHSA1/START domain
VQDGTRRYVTFIDTSYEEVWDALTAAARHADWNVAPCLQFGNRTGGRCVWGEPGRPVISGRVVSWRPSRGTFAHTFSFTGTEFANEPESLVEWEAEEQGEVVSVSLSHHLGGRRERPRTRSIVEDGWFLVLARLKTLLETGEPMPWPAGPDE